MDVHPLPYYYEIIPTEDCRILVIGSIESILLLDNEYNYDFEKMREDYDLIYGTTCSRTMNVTALIFDEELKRIESKLNSPLILHGWDCESALFLNPKFTVGDRIEIKEVDWDD